MSPRAAASVCAGAGAAFASGSFERSHAVAASNNQAIAAARAFIASSEALSMRAIGRNHALARASRC
ncbi:MAG TPA: hypothetical protein VFT98_14165, partial [Myxococcota bacterium]|nr:hypothetical protein [Myxococcota bacterium]